jgi:2-hydroxychromene-2-carboxylate isomerase
LRAVADPARREKRRAVFELERGRAGEPHRVEYFHQVDDPYSHLSAQLLQPLLDTYDVELVPHLVRGPQGDNVLEPEMLSAYARRDCALVAPHYGLEFPGDRAVPSAKRVRLANRLLARADKADFPQLAVTVGKALWSADITDLNVLEDHLGAASHEETGLSLDIGAARCAELGHYAGAMFYYAGEWYWGADRFYHLENRLSELSARRIGGSQLLVPRPRIELGTLKDDRTLTLEIYASLRSPYSSIIFDKTVELARATRVRLHTRPVLPLVMRGATVTPEKGLYIFEDAAREAEALGLSWGKFSDPVGEPVRRAYALYPWALAEGKAAELMGSFMKAAFQEGVSTAGSRGLRRVVEAAGLSWKQALSHFNSTEWRDVLARNQQDLYASGCWGVPSFRLLNEKAEALLEVWGQDRLWLVARTIQEELRKRQV